MPQCGEIQKLNCGKCKKETTHIFYEEKSNYYVTTGWKCTGCGRRLVVKRTPV